MKQTTKTRYFQYTIRLFLTLIYFICSQLLVCKESMEGCKCEFGDERWRNGRGVWIAQEGGVVLWSLIYVLLTLRICLCPLTRCLDVLVFPLRYVGPGVSPKKFCPELSRCMSIILCWRLESMYMFSSFFWIWWNQVFLGNLMWLRKIFTMAFHSFEFYYSSKNIFWILCVLQFDPIHIIGSLHV